MAHVDFPTQDGESAAPDHAAPAAPKAVPQAAQDDHVTPKPPAPEALDQAAKPAPIGNVDHDGVVVRDGFFFFRDDYQLPKEPSAEDAEARYLGEVEKAFQNRWPLHPNLIFRRSDAVKVKHAYDLDFRDNEIKRIRDILPVDAPVFDYIDALVDVVMLKNLDIYVKERLDAFNAIVRATREWFAAFAAVFLAVIIGAYWGPGGLPPVLYWELAPVGAIGIAALLVRYTTARRLWRVLIKLELKGRKEKYEESVRDAAGLAATKLAAKGRDVETLMNALKNKLDTVRAPNAARVEHAPKQVRVLLWSPERMGLIENYYRAKVDQFMVKSARVSLDATVNTNGLIQNRVIFLAAATCFFLLDLCITGVIRICSDWPWIQTANGFNLRGFLVVLTLLLLSTAATAAVAISAAFLAHRSHEFEPEDVARRNKTLLMNGIRAASFAVLVGTVPVVAVWAFPHAFWPVMALALAVLLFCYVWLGIPIAYAHLIFRKYEDEYSSNVLEAVQRKMDASQWTRYSDLRIDQRIAEVFTAIYEAWRKADSKGLYGNTE
jgi:hypothetical protein